MTITYNDLCLCSGLINEVRDSQERIDRLRSHMERCTPKLSETGDRHTNSTGDKYADVLQKIQDIEIASGEKIAAYIEHVQVVIDAIDQQVTDSAQRRVLSLRFIDGLCWGEICARTFYSDRYARTLCDRGLRALGIKRPPRRKKCKSADNSRSKCDNVAM